MSRQFYGFRKAVCGMMKVSEADRILRDAAKHLGPHEVVAVGVISRILLSLPIPRDPKQAATMQRYADQVPTWE